jgi:hypothetical protein
MIKQREQPQTEFERFDSTVGKMLSISREELQRREAEWKKQRKRKKRKVAP